MSDTTSYTMGRAVWSLIPEHMIAGLRLYIEYGVQPGDFLRAVLCNDLRLAVLTADHINLRRITDFVHFLYDYAPIACWGSVEKFDNWIEHRGLSGVTK